MIPILTLCSLDCLHGMVDVYNYIIRVVYVLTFIHLVQPFEGQRWVTDASMNMKTGLITVPIVVQANMLKCSYRPHPQIDIHTWQHFEQYIKSMADMRKGCIFDAIIGDLPVRHWRFSDLCNLLLDETPLFASTDGLVHTDLKSASAGWLFWSVVDDANFPMPTDGDDASASPIVVLTCGTKIVHGRFDSITSYRAEGTGLLTILFLAAHLMTFLNLDSPPIINHNCDNQELIFQVESSRGNRRFSETPRWERGHPER